MDDKQIFAYSWQDNLKKKIKKYFEERRKKAANVITRIDEEPSEKKEDKDAKSVSKPESPIKNPDKKQSKQRESILVRKENMEKKLTLFIGGLILFVMLAGIALGNGLIVLPFFKTPVKHAVISPTPTPEVLISPTISPTDNITVKPSPTTAGKISTTPAATKCKVSGCNGELCIDESLGEVSSICLYQEKYVCYKSARCKRQQDGKCGWTQDPELKTCLETYQ